MATVTVVAGGKNQLLSEVLNFHTCVLWKISINTDSFKTKRRKVPTIICSSSDVTIRIYDIYDASRWQRMHTVHFRVGFTRSTKTRGMIETSVNEALRSVSEVSVCYF